MFGGVWGLEYWNLKGGWGVGIGVLESQGGVGCGDWGVGVSYPQDDPQVDTEKTPNKLQMIENRCGFHYPSMDFQCSVLYFGRATRCNAPLFHPKRCGGCWPKALDTIKILYYYFIFFYILMLLDYYVNI